MSGVGPEQQRIADLMSESWLAFARNGNPNNKLVPDWPAYSPPERAAMVFDLQPKVVKDPHGVERVSSTRSRWARRGEGPAFPFASAGMTLRVGPNGYGSPPPTKAMTEVQ